MEKSKVVKSLIFKFSERFAVKGIGFIISIILARLLAPELFGQVVLLTMFTDLSIKLIDGGLGTALVQSREVDDRDYSTVFYLTFLMTCLMVGILQLAAPHIANYYESPQLEAPLRFYSFSLFLSAFNSIQVARIQREMRFREMMFCNLFATVLSGAMGILAAFMGLGLWAILIYFFAQVAMSSIAMLFVLRWLPHSRFSMDSARRLYGYGIKMMIASVISVIYNNIRPLIIGKRFSTTALGYYDRGARFSSIISSNLDSAVQSVMFPVLSSAQDDKIQFNGILSRTKRLGSFILFPAMLGMAAVAEPMVRLLLTEEWLPCVIYVQLLCVGEMMLPVTSSNMLGIQSIGRSDLYAKLEALRRVLMLIVLAISVICFDSVLAIAVGFVISAWLDTIVTAIPVRRVLGYGFRRQLGDIWKNALASLIMAAAVYAFGLISMPLIIKLMLQLMLGVAVYVAVNYIIANESFFYLLKTIKNKRAK